MSILHEFQRAIFPCCLRLVSRSGRLVFLCVAHVDMTLTRSKVKVTGLLSFRKLRFESPSPPQVCGEARNLWLITVAWNLVYSLLEPDFWSFFLVSYHITSNFQECRHYMTSKGHISLPRNAAVTWSSMPVVLCTVYADVTLTRSRVKITRSWSFI